MEKPRFYQKHEFLVNQLLKEAEKREDNILRVKDALGKRSEVVTPSKPANSPKGKRR